MSLGLNGIISLQFARSYEFDSRQKLNLGNVTKIAFAREFD